MASKHFIIISSIFTLFTGLIVGYIVSDQNKPNSLPQTQNESSFLPQIQEIANKDIDIKVYINITGIVRKITNSTITVEEISSKELISMELVNEEIAITNDISVTSLYYNTPLDGASTNLGKISDLKEGDNVSVSIISLLDSNKLYANSFYVTN